MPNIRSAAKAMRSSARKRLRNKSTTSALKTFMSRAEGLITGNQVEAAGAAVVKAVSALDKAAQKGIIAANNAARHKSRLMKKLSDARKAAEAAAAAAKPQPEAARPKKRTTKSVAVAASQEPEAAKPKRRSTTKAPPQA